MRSNISFQFGFQLRNEIIDTFPTVFNIDNPAKNLGIMVSKIVLMKHNTEHRALITI